MHRDTDELFDAADQSWREDRDYDDWRQKELDDERELLTAKALTEAKEKGVSVESLKWLARETGALRWALEQSLKGEQA
jgi:hypothetical protein